MTHFRIGIFTITLGEWRSADVPRAMVYRSNFEDLPGCSVFGVQFRLGRAPAWDYGTRRLPRSQPYSRALRLAWNHRHKAGNQHPGEAFTGLFAQ